MTPEAVWYQGHRLAYPLMPLSWLYRGAVQLRRTAYRRGVLPQGHPGVPVIVVGNLTVGGTGKTPLVLWLAQWLAQQGLNPGILARGYRGRARNWPRWVTAESDPEEVGDEAVLLARRSARPTAAGPDRTASAAMLVQHGECDIIVSDDGLQHYPLRRDLEILVVDGQRRLGNGHCLPAGPLREPQTRLATVDLLVCHGAEWPGGYRMELIGERLVALSNPLHLRDLAELRGLAVTAVAGVGNPQRFFRRLRAAGLNVRERAYPDHHRFRPEDVASWPPGPVVMTEKDAVKCSGLSGPDHWYLPVAARLEGAFETELKQRIEALIDGQETTRHPGVLPVQGATALRQAGRRAHLSGRPTRLPDSRRHPDHA